MEDDPVIIGVYHVIDERDVHRFVIVNERQLRTDRRGY
jgi:hypothetical protein